MKANYKNYEIDNKQVALPDTYEFQDLIEVKAEPDCIAMLRDKEGKLPELWVYIDYIEFTTMKKYMFNEDADWNFDEFSIYKKDGEHLARARFDEDWYGTALINECYYRNEAKDKVLWYDFAYENTADAKAMHAFVEEMAESLGF